ncbi:MAG TPA: hypothetical protein VFF06_05450 [Polyangia bacterium]|nr:hypothetical protein [Polyangia bacterium]
MRRLAICAILLGAIGCDHDHACRAQTLLLGLTLDAQAGAADSLVVRVTVGGGPTINNPPLAHAPGDRIGSIEIDFPRGYQAGAVIVISVDAVASGAVVATRSVTTVLADGCSLAQLDFTTDGGD